MPNPFKKPKRPSAPLPEDLDLEAFFTDVEHLRQVFCELVAAPTLPRRMLIIHGVGGIGKSTLLRMYRLYCRRQSIPVALVSGDEAKSTVDVLRGLEQDLAQGGVKLPHFAKTYDHYRAIQTRVEEQARKDTHGKGADLAGKAIAKTAEATAGAAVGAAVGSVVPVVGIAIGTALGGVVGAMGGEVFRDWLRGFLSKADLDLYLDPAARLTQDFVEDSASAAEKQRLVLMLDTYEQIAELDKWVRGLVQALHPNVLTVIAGREMPGEAWDRDWPGWMAHARIEALEAMTEENMRTLVRRYYATMRGDEPDPAQVEEIVSFARGLPLVVTSVVRLWVRYEMQDFSAVKSQVVADLADRLMEGTPPGMRPALEAAAALRWFNKELLRVLLPTERVEAAYHELQCFPFVRPRAEGLTLHDMVRGILDENLKVHDPERHRTLHERAVGYFEKRLEKATSEEAERLGLERLYHYICVDEGTGIEYFQRIAEELLNCSLSNRLRTLLKDVSTYPLEHSNSKLWRDYYSGRLEGMETRHEEAIVVYERILQNQGLDIRLRQYSMGEIGLSLAKPELLSRPGNAETAETLLQRAYVSLPKQDTNAIRYYWELLAIYRRLGQWNRVLELCDSLSEMLNGLDSNRQAEFKCNLRVLWGTVGDWQRFLDVQRELAELSGSIKHPHTEVRTLNQWIFALLWMGRYAEVERLCRWGLDTYLQLGYDDVAYLYRNIAFALGLQHRFQEAEECRAKFLEVERNAGKTRIALERVTAIAYGFWGPSDILAGRFHEARQKLVYSLWIKRSIEDHIGIPEVLVGLGILYEVTKRTSLAMRYYLRCIRFRWAGRRHFECAALTGMVRVKHAQGNHAAIPPLLAEAEQLAQQYEYNDHLASLRLTQGHIAWDGHLDDWGTGFDVALAQYQQAVTCALRYNRFLLDEVLWGGGICTPLDPIIPHCQGRADDGRRMLQALRDWWQTGVNSVGTPRPDTISPIPEGIPLLEAERIARQREPGDGSTQKTVTEKLDAALAEMG